MRDSEFRELFLAQYRSICGRLSLILGDPSIAEDVAQEAFLKLYLWAREGGTGPNETAIPAGQHHLTREQERSGPGRVDGESFEEPAESLQAVSGNPNEAAPSGLVGSVPAKAWLMRVAVNIAYNHIRGERRRIKRERMFCLETGNLGNTYQGGWEGEPAPELGRDPASASPEIETVRREEVEAVRKVLARMPARDRALLVLKYSGWAYSDIAETIGVRTSSVGSLLARARLRFRKEYMSYAGGEG